MNLMILMNWRSTIMSNVLKFSSLRVSKDNALKSYFAERFNLSTLNMIEYLQKIVNSQEKGRLSYDHRWINLTITIRQNLKLFNLSEKIKMLCLLTSCEAGKQTGVDILNNIVDLSVISPIQISLSQAADCLWGMAKLSHNNVNNAKFFCDAIIQNLEIKANTTFTLKRKDEIDLIKILWAVNKLRINDPKLMKVLLEVLKKGNMENFEITHLCSIFASLVKIGLAKKRITAQIKSIIKRRHSELQHCEIIIFKNILHPLSLTLQSNISNNLIDEKQKIKGQKVSQNTISDQKFTLWVCQTIFLRYDKKLSLKTGLYLLMCLNKGKLFDYQIYKEIIRVVNQQIKQIRISQFTQTTNILLTSLFFFNESNNLKNLMNDVKPIVKRLWQLYNMMNNAEKKIVFGLFKKNLIQPPSHLKNNFLKQYTINSDEQQLKKNEK